MRLLSSVSGLGVCLSDGAYRTKMSFPFSHLGGKRQAKWKQ